MTSTSQVCSCGKGHVSLHDGKCGHCRTKKEQKARDQAMYQDNRMQSLLRELQAKIDKTGTSP